VPLLHQKGRILPDIKIDSRVLRSFRSGMQTSPSKYARQDLAIAPFTSRSADHSLVATAKVFDLALVTPDWAAFEHARHLCIG
jgi:predicted nucleic acid-binding protein